MDELFIFTFPIRFIAYTDREFYNF